MRTYAWDRGYENVRNATGRGQNRPFFAYIIYGWPHKPSVVIENQNYDSDWYPGDWTESSLHYHDTLDIDY